PLLPAILAFGRSVLARFGILPTLAIKAGSIGTGDPSLAIWFASERWLRFVNPRNPLGAASRTATQAGRAGCPSPP
ncbi:MAG: hypothetical protein ACKOCX_03995, partial [Planctomycetota bacterium]